MPETGARHPEKTDGAYRSIGEVARELDVPSHVLRYWESRFSTFIKPRRHHGGRRMFRADDVKTFHAIYALVAKQGVTMKRAQELLADHGVDKILSKIQFAHPVSGTGTTSISKNGLVNDGQANTRAPDSHDINAHADMRPNQFSRENRCLQAVLMQIQDLRIRIDEVRAGKRF